MKYDKVMPFTLFLMMELGGRPTVNSSVALLLLISLSVHLFVQTTSSRGIHHL